MWLWCTECQSTCSGHRLKQSLKSIGFDSSSNALWSRFNFPFRTPSQRMQMVFSRWWCRCFSELRTHSLPCHLQRGVIRCSTSNVDSTTILWNPFLKFPHKEIHFPFSFFYSSVFLPPTAGISKFTFWFMHYYPKPLSWYNISWCSFSAMNALWDKCWSSLEDRPSLWRDLFWVALNRSSPSLSCSAEVTIAC